MLSKNNKKLLIKITVSFFLNQKLRNPKRKLLNRLNADFMSLRK